MSNNSNQGNGSKGNANKKKKRQNKKKSPPIVHPPTVIYERATKQSQRDVCFLYVFNFI
jgi:hypothetical protein